MTEKEQNGTMFDIYFGNLKYFLTVSKYLNSEIFIGNDKNTTLARHPPAKVKYLFLRNLDHSFNSFKSHPAPSFIKIGK